MKVRLPILLLTMSLSFPLAVPATPGGSDAAGPVTIPFKFIVGDTLLPRGTYQIWSESGDWEIMNIATAGSRKIVASARTSPTARRAPNDRKVHLQFDNYYGQYFLVWIGLPLRDGHELKVTRERAVRALVRLNLMPAEPADISKQ